MVIATLRHADESVANLCDALDHADFGVAIVGTDGEVGYANPPFATSLAATVGDLIDSIFEHLVPATLRSEVVAALTLARQSGASRCSWIAETELTMGRADQFAPGAIIVRVAGQNKDVEDLVLTVTEDLRGPLRDLFR